MTYRKIIKIVTGHWGSHVLNGLWSGLSSRYTVEMLVLAPADGTKVETNLPVVIFPEVLDMPGYYRNLENYLQGSDLIVAFESSKLSSFQTLRISRSFGIPCVIVNHEITAHSYENHMNILAIRHDIHQNADAFITSSSRASRLLMAEGVGAERISKLPFFTDAMAFSFAKSRRDKFRHYIGLTSDHKITFARCSFDSVEFAKSLFQAWRSFLFQRRHQNIEQYKLIVLGGGKNLETLKYFAADTGIGKHVIFIDQDPTPFWYDAACAADLILWDRPRLGLDGDSYPFEFAQALSTGVRCAIPAGTIYDEVAGNAAVIRLGDLSVLDFVETFQDTFQASANLVELRPVESESMQSMFDMTLTTNQVATLFQRLMDASQDSPVRERVESFLSHYRDPILRRDIKDQDVLIEEFLLNQNLEAASKAELWRLKGDIAVAMGQQDAAITAFEKALLWDERCFRAYRGLGYLAWTGHSHEESMSFFKRALAIEHNDYHSLVGVGIIYRRLKMLDEAVFWLNKAVDQRGCESHSLGLLIQACLEHADAVLSLKTLEQLRESFGDLPVILRGLSQVYLAHGMVEKANPLLDQACA